jgi:DNA polymerase III subunit alpha
MSSLPFVHLHCHSHYSLLDGASKVPALIARAKSLGMPALAITDHGNLHGAAEFLREAKGADFKPIVGIEAYVAPRHRTERTGGGFSGNEHNFHLTLLARTGEGVRNLMRLSSKSFLEGFYYKPRIDKEILERHSEGLICLSGCVSSEFSDHLLHDKFAEAEALAAWYQKIFGPENFFIEIQNNNVQIQRDHLSRAVDLANRMGLPLVGTSDAHYLTAGDAKAHDVLLCVNMGKTVDDPGRMRFESDEFHVRSPEEMYAAMPGHEEALKRTAEIAERVEDHYKSLHFGKRQFPSFAPPEGKTPESYLQELCDQGLVDRYGPNPPQEAVDRLEHELATINRMGFASYFLIVWDFVRFARENEISSAARGSACGAIVSYVLQLSHVCPLKYDLLFERFLDPNRSEAPDIDIDIEQDRRYEVIEYVRKKYGAANVAQIGTFLTLGAKAAVKDVGRALNVSLARVEQVTKLIPSTPLHMTIEGALKAEPALKRLYDEDPEIQKLIDLAQRIEGLARNVSTHPAGVVIADRPLEEMVPLQKLPNKDKDKEVVSTQWTMGDVEKAGLLKMDFLGLRNLSSLGAAAKLINELNPGNPIDLNNLPLDDPKTYELLQRGETKGVFQFESAGIRDLLIKMKPDRFADIIATSALYRPGPLNGGMVDEYVNVKNARKKAEYSHPVLKEILEETYGVMVYQEQVMRILNRLGGVDLSQAYGCIKAISKKKTDIITQGRKQFIDGAVSRGLEKERAADIFKMIEDFGGYGFNKSHSTAYALLTFQTAWLKAHHPTEFMAAILSSEMDGAERDKFFYEHIDDCKRMGIEVLPPDVNASGMDFRPAGEGKVHFGLGAIKGVGTKAVEAILKARTAGGPYRGLDDFFERLSTTVVGQGCVETLIKAGAFDCLKARRSQLLAVLPRAVQAGQSRQADLRRGQRGLFDDVEAAEPESVGLSLPDVPEMADAEKLAEEKKALGFYMSSHPLARHAMVLQAFRSHQVSDLSDLADKAEVTLGGMISGLTIRNVQKSRSGLTRMAKLTFEDLGGSTPAMLWPEEFAKSEALLKDDAVVFIKGKISRMRDPAEVIIDRVIPIENAAAELSRGVVVRLHKGVVGREDFERLQRHMKNRQGNLDVYLELIGLEGVRRAIYKAGQGLKIRHDEKLVSDFESAVGAGNVRLLGQGGTTTAPRPTPRPLAQNDDAMATIEDEDES